MKKYLVTASQTHLGHKPILGEFDDAQSANDFAQAQLKTSPLVIIVNRDTMVGTHLRNKLSLIKREG